MNEVLTVMCDGKDNDPLGHPCIYLAVEPDSVIICPYCGKEFRYEKS